MVLFGGSFQGTWVGNIDGAGPGGGGPLVDSEGTRVENKLGISDGEVPGITLVVADRIKLGCDEGSWWVLSGGSFEGARDGNHEDGI